MIDLLRILIAPLVWLASFSAVYGLHGIGCSLGWTEIDLLFLSLFRIVLLAAWAGAVLLQIALVVALHSRRFSSDSPFVRRTSIATGWVGLVAALWTLSPVATTSSCS